MPSSEQREGVDLSKAFADLCQACRSGDYEVVDSLLSTRNLNINQVDEWDYSPLILASLCGHLKIVGLLLSRGAVCDRDTFQGARCVYGALTGDIRNLLISFDLSKAVDMSQPFASHISSLLGPLNQTLTKDISFYFPRVNGAMALDLQSFRLNRFLLAARSPYFREKLQGPWKYKSVVKMPSISDPAVFKIIVDYIYLRSDTLPIDQALTQDELAKFAKKLKLEDLAEGIERIKNVVYKKQKAKIKHDLAHKFVEKARQDLETFLKDSIFKNLVSSELNLTEEVEFEDIQTSEYLTDEQKHQLIESGSLPDIILSCIDSESERVVFFPVNKSIVSRSEYFDTMFKSDIFSSSQVDIPVYKDFLETANTDIIDRPALLPPHIPVIQLSTSISSVVVSHMLLSYLYHDDIHEITLSSTIELLFAADELFMDRLKTICAVNITSNFNKFTIDEFQKIQDSVGYNAYDLIRISWQTRCDKLEQHITKMIAHGLGFIYGEEKERKELLLLINESAARITERQDTDTIELIDDIRYYLSKKYSVKDEFKDFDPLGDQFQDGSALSKPSDIKVLRSAWLKYQADIDMVDGLLEELDLAA
ncbi:uncharacterized protein CANTADRAFT_44730 [Suhomyces tanzawaensis NRRL Y-17324]|uniref:BTB domain-containing protein n=1 Tax=Suhomyces tanzawaensis NRRL Y-17324 TaxID=984487 RepID=A0A1E4SRH7_9ASCO|nr:uncharacterized protein CANTADRAFT_44730 [Suhomyces tanzawaensis NRRL Y-17324]ODV82104.1 hypothetical protein CANTADRAFT_44730 [Suhomyces tanzawaensis NRRL Y-17324]